MVKDAPYRLQRLQDRINFIFRNSPSERASRHFSQYVDTSWTQLEEKLYQAASTGGIEGVEQALNEFDLLRETQDVSRLRYALMSFLVNSKEVGKLGLFVPSLEERSPQKVIPSKHEGIHNNLPTDPKEEHGES